MISTLLTPERIVPRIYATRANAVLRALGEHLAGQYPEVTAGEVVRALREREELGSTALEEGLAIPHAKLPSAERTMAVLGRSVRGVGFGAPDGKPTHFFFVLLAPSHSTGDHLKILARISRMFRDKSFRERLMAADTAGEMYRLLAAADTKE